MKKVMIGKLKFTIFCFLPLLIFLGLAETCARVYVNYQKSKSGFARYWVRFNQRLDSPAYKNKPWFSKEFLHESLGRIELYIPEGTQMILSRDSYKPSVAVFNGLRLTTGFKNIKGDRPIKLFVLGGSTVFCRSVPNYLTWASRLQEFLMEKEKVVRVFNLGTISITSTQEIARLKYEINIGNIPDVLVIYHGVNDVYQGIIKRNPGGIMLDGLDAKSKRKKMVERSNQDYINKISIFLRKHSTFYALLFKAVSTSTPVPSYIADSKKLSNLVKQTVDLYGKNVWEVQKICRRHGIKLLVFLQPNIYILNRPLSPYERSIVRYWGEGLSRAYKSCYPELRKLLKILDRKGVLIWDLSNIFDAVKKPIFLDFCHVESDGNELIAKAILPKILAHLPNSQLLANAPDALRYEKVNSWAKGCLLALRFDSLYLNGKNGKMQLEDLSKNGNNGILGEKGFIMVKNSNKLQPHDFTISCQFLVGKTSCRKTIFAKALEGKRFDSYRLNFRNKGVLEFHIGNRSFVVAREIRNLKWYHLVLKKSGMMMTAWLDGVLVAVKRGLPAVIEYDSRPLLIGSGEDDSGNSTRDSRFFGHVDQFVIWNRVLADQEINDLFDYSKTYHDYCANIDRFYQQVQSRDI